MGAKFRELLRCSMQSPDCRIEEVPRCAPTGDPRSWHISDMTVRALLLARFLSCLLYVAPELDATKTRLRSPHVARTLLRTLPTKVAPLHLETQSADQWDPITFIVLVLEPAALLPFQAITPVFVRWILLITLGLVESRVRYMRFPFQISDRWTGIQASSFKS